MINGNIQKNCQDLLSGHRSAENFPLMKTHSIYTSMWQTESSAWSTRTCGGKADWRTVQSCWNMCYQNKEPTRSLTLSSITAACTPEPNFLSQSPWSPHSPRAIYTSQNTFFNLSVNFLNLYVKTKLTGLWCTGWRSNCQDLSHNCITN